MTTPYNVALQQSSRFGRGAALADEPRQQLHGARTGSQLNLGALYNSNDNGIGVSDDAR
jgi:hypothetical protein